MDTHLPILTTPVFTAQAVAPGTPVTSKAISLVNAQSNGFFSIYLSLAGDGTLGLVYEVTIDGANWVQPSTETAITTAFGKTSGIATNGTDILAFNPELATAIRFKATATSASITITATLCMQ